MYKNNEQARESGVKQTDGLGQYQLNQRGDLSYEKHYFTLTPEFANEITNEITNQIRNETENAGRLHRNDSTMGRFQCINTGCVSDTQR